MNRHISFLMLGIFIMLLSPVTVGWNTNISTILLISGILVILVWLYLVYIEGHVYYLNAQEDTRYVRLATALGNNPHVIRTVELSMRSSLRIWPKLQSGPIKFVGDTDVPLSFAAEFLRRSDNTYVCSINKFSEGEVWVEGEVDFGACRMLAGQLLDYFINLDWVTRSPQGSHNGTRWSSPDIHPGVIKLALEIPTRAVENT